MRLSLALFLVCPLSAMAENPLPSTGFVEVLPVGNAVGDGATAVRVRVLALRPDGSPMDDLSVKISATGGEASGWAYVGEGIYSFDVVPERIETSGRLSLRIKGKTEDKLKISLVAAMPVQAPAPLAMTVSANPGSLIAGPDVETNITFNLGDSPVNIDDIRIRTSLGELGELTSMGGGRYVAKLVVGELKGPALATITASDAHRPGRIYGATTVPVSVQRLQKVRGKSGSSVLLKVAGRDFGPVEIKGGYAKVDVQIPPGASEATQVTVLGDGVTRESSIDLDVAQRPRLQFLPAHEGIPGDESLEIVLRLAVYKGDGTADSAAKPVVSTDAGTIGEVRHEGDGIYSIAFTPATRSVAQAFDIEAALPDEKGQTDRIVLNMTPARPSQVELSVDPSPLQGQKVATFKARLVGPGGAGLVGRELDWNLTGATLSGDVKEGDDGVYMAPIKTYGGPVELLATARTAAAGNPVHQLVMFPLRGWLPGDTVSSVPITVLALDELGYPVEGVLVNLMLDSGDGTLPQQVTTDSNGLAQVYYTAGKGLRMVRVRAHAGPASDAAAFLQGPNQLRNVRLPRSGTDAHLSLLELWTPSAAMLRVEP